MKTAPQVNDQVVTQAETVRCEGNGGPLGHPAVYLTFDTTGLLTCPYCSKKFVKEVLAP